MNCYKFKVRGHKNISGTHANTLEFTKEKHLTPTGDCIIGVDADFSYFFLKKFLNLSVVKVTLCIDNLSDSFLCRPNSNFFSDSEIVIRRSEYDSERTFAFKTEKTSSEINREIIERLKNPESIMIVIIEEINHS
jgi:uncharacterized protein